MLSYALTYSNLLSPTSQRLAVRPFSPERETYSILHVYKAFAFSSFYRIPSALPLQSFEDCTVTHTAYIMYEYIVRSGRIVPNKKDTVSGVSFYSAIQLPAAISIWESSGFHSSVGCGSRRQYFVFAPHQARPQTRLSLLWKSSGFLNHMDSQPGTTRLCCAAKYFGADGVTTTDCRYCRQFHCS